eukprot:scaffold155351_cov31-Tisochrysis_lutea.AAC.7
MSLRMKRSHNQEAQLPRSILARGTDRGLVPSAPSSPLPTLWLADAINGPAHRKASSILRRGELCTREWCTELWSLPMGLRRSSQLDAAAVSLGEAHSWKASVASSPAFAERAETLTAR